MRVAHVMQRGTRTGGYPSAIIAVDVETEGQPTEINPSVIVALKFGHSIYERSDDRSARRDVLDFTDANAFWDWATSKTRKNTRLYVCAHNAGFDMAVLQYERMLRSRGWTVRLEKSVWPTDGEGPLWLTWTKDSRTICLFNTGNLYPGSLESIGEAIGYHKLLADLTHEEKLKVLQAHPGSKLWDTLTAYCRQDAEIVLQAMHVWTRFCIEHDLGPFSHSLAGQALQGFRHRFLNHKLYLHNRKSALELERAAYFGGKTGCRYVGRWNGPITVYDVNSLYPSVMLDNPMPTRLLGVYHDLSPRDVNRYVDRHNLVIAECEVAIEHEEDAILPVRHDGRLIFPVGRFVTTLCTPEYVEAVRLGLVKHVRRVAVYQGASIFHDYVDYFYRLRLEYKRSGNETFAYICKLFLNSLYGKFGQYTYDWTPFDNPFFKMESGTESWTLPSGETIHLRKLGDTVQRRSETRVDGYNAFAAIAAHVTSYARMTLLKFERIAGPDGYLMFDTDSLFCTAAGAARIEASGYVDASKLGYLKREDKGSETGGTIYAPKDYAMDGHDAVIKGVRKDAVRIDQNTFEQVQFRGIAGAARDHDVNHAEIQLVRKMLRRDYRKGIVLKNGWVQPVRLGVS